MEKKKINIGDFEWELKFPDDFLDNSSVNEYMNEWIKVIEKNKLKEKRELRLKKINEINAKQNKD